VSFVLAAYGIVLGALGAYTLRLARARKELRKYPSNGRP
jgi:CcmD family protein